MATNRAIQTLQTSSGFWRASRYDGSGDWLDESGNGHHFQFGAGSAAPLYLPYQGVQYCYLPGNSSNTVSTPDTAALSITGDIDLRVWCALSNWASGSTQTLIAKYTTTGNQRAYQFSIAGSGVPQLTVSANGTATTNAASTVATGLANDALKWQRVTWRASDGRVQFFMSDDGVTWTQLGVDRTAAVGSLADTTAVVEVGSITAGAASQATGKFYRAQVYNGIAGTLVFDADFTNQVTLVSPDTSFVESSAQAATVTIGRNANGRKSSVVRAPQFLLGTDDFFEQADHADFNLGTTDSGTALVVIRAYGIAAVRTMFCKKNANTSGAGWSLIGIATNAISFRVSDGNTEGFAAESNNTLVNGVQQSSGGVRPPGVNLQVYKNGVNTATGSGAGGSPSNTSVVRIGAYASGANFYDGVILGAAFWRAALTGSELTRAAAELLL